MMSCPMFWTGLMVVALIAYGECSASGIETGFESRSPLSTHADAASRPDT